MFTLQIRHFPNCYDHLHAFNCPWDFDESFSIPDDESGFWFVEGPELSLMISLLAVQGLQDDHPEEVAYLRSFL